MGANDRQVGGAHYKVGGEEHWDRVARLGLDYFQGQITKYVERWKGKGGIQDLEKARHFLDKYIEVETQKAMDKAAEEVVKAVTGWKVEQKDGNMVASHGAESAGGKEISRRKVRSARKA
jgi:hypothetical protein